MKKILLSFFILLFASSAMAFDWRPAVNDTLRAHMFRFTEQFIQQAMGTEAERSLKDFLRKQQKIADKQPYAWIEATHAVVAKLKEIYPPRIDDGGQESIIRRNIVKLVDYPLHVNNRAKETPDAEKEAFNHATNTYLASTRQMALDWLSQPAPDSGSVDICLVYNMGTFIRTNQRTFAMDICWKGTPEEAAFIAKAIDVIFVSHPHQDHYTPFLLQAMADAGKPIVTPAKSLPGFNDRRVIAITSTMFYPITVAGIDIRVLHGAQEVGERDSIPNNTYMLHFDGFTLINQGENENIPIQLQLPVWPRPDIVIAPSWNQILYFLEPIMRSHGARVNPPLFLPLHQNEMGHRVQQRESFWELWNRRDRLGNPDFHYPPYMVMDNGEHFVYKKK
ncbi:MAG: MBL fold metallo-hydrolase [Bacteroidales bacterium]|nr:MBL fold metallo-hydrolase [Bacteroidales bacterium]